MRVKAKHSVHGFVKGAVYKAKKTGFRHLSVYVGGGYQKTARKNFEILINNEM